MKNQKIKLGKQEFEKQENKINFVAGLAAGGISAAITNPLECITVNKQTAGADFSIRQFIRENGMINLCT